MLCLLLVARSYRIYDEDVVGIILINLLFMKIPSENEQNEDGEHFHCNAGINYSYDRHTHRDKVRAKEQPSTFYIYFGCLLGMGF